MLGDLLPATRKMMHQAACLLICLPSGATMSPQTSVALTVVGSFGSIEVHEPQSDPISQVGVF